MFLYRTVHILLYGLALAGALILSLFALSGSKERGVNRTSATACILSCSGAFVLFGLSVVDPSFSVPVQGMVILATLFWVGNLFGIFLGVLGLRQISKDESGLAKGTGYAWSAILIGLAFQFCLGEVAVASVIARMPRLKPPPGASQLAGKGMTMGLPQVTEAFENFPSLNFRFKVPKPPWVKFDFSKMNADAVLGYVNPHDDTNFMILVEKGAVIEEKLLQPVASAVIDALQHGISDSHVVKEENWTVKGMAGYRFLMRGTLEGHDSRFLYWIHVKDGTYYRLVVWHPWNHPEKELLDAFEELGNRFETLSRGRVPQPKDKGVLPKEDFESKSLGYIVRSKYTSWEPHDDLGAALPLAEYGLVHPSGVNFFVIPFALPDANLSLNVFARSSLSLVNIPFESIPLSLLTKVSDKGYEGYLFEHEKVVEGAQYFYKVKLLKGRDRGFILVTVQNVSLWKKDPELHDAAFKLFEIVKRDATIKMEQLSLEDKRRSATLLRNIGVIVHQEGNANEAVRYLEAAQRLVPDDEAVLQDLSLVLFQTARYEELRTLLLGNLGRFPWDATLRILDAKLSYETGRKEEAVKKFEDLIGSGIRTPEAMTGYIEMLWEVGRKEVAFKFVQDNLAYANGADLRLLLVQLLNKGGEVEKAIEEAEKLHADFPYHQNVRNTLFKLLYEKGRYEELLVLADREGSQHRGGYEVSMYRGLGQIGLKRYKDALASFEEALKSQPGDPGAKSYVDELKKAFGAVDISEVGRPLEMVEVPSELLETPETLRKKVVALGGRSYYEFQVTAIRFRQNEALRTTLYRRIKVGSAEDLQRFSEFELKYDSFNEQIYVNKVEVKDEQGKLLGQADPSKYYIVDDSDAGYASHNKVLHVPVPGLKVGCTIDLVVSHQDKFLSETMRYKEFIFGARDAVLREAVSLTGDKDKVSSVALNGVREEEHGVFKVWLAEAIQALKLSDYLPVRERFLPMLKLGDSQQNWAEVGDSYLDKIKEHLVIDPKVKNLAQELTTTAHTNEEKVTALFRYVQDEYAYKAIEFGLRSLIPQPAAKTLQTKYGDCKDHSLLFHSLLQAVGIPAYLALVRHDGLVDSSLPSLEQFDHMIVYVPGYLPNAFLDTTAKDIEINLLAASLRNNQILVLEQGRSHLTPTVATPGMKTRIVADRSLELQGNDLVGQEKVTLSGYEAESIRMVLRLLPEVSRIQGFQEFLSRRFRKLILQDLQAENLLERQKPLVLHLRYRIPNAMYFTGNQWVSELLPLWEETFFEMSYEAARKYPFEFQYPIEIESRARFVYPKKFNPAPTVQSKKLDFQSAEIRLGGSVELVNVGLEVSTTASRSEGVFPASKYETVQKNVEQIFESLRLKVFLEGQGQ